MPHPIDTRLAPACVAVQLLDSATGRPVRDWQFHGKQTVSIGRGLDQDVQISDPYVSRTHAELRWDAIAWKLVSLGRHSVRVEGEAITEIPVEKQITFRLGSEGPTLRFDPAAAVSDNRMTMMFDSTLVSDLFEVDKSKRDREVGEIEQENYFQELQKRARQLRDLRSQK